MATIRKRSGRWQAMIRRSGHPQISKTFTTKRDCLLWAREQESKVERGIYIAMDCDRTLTLGHLIDRYCSDELPQLRGHVSEGYRLERLRERLGQLKLIQITQSALAEYRDSRLELVSPAAVKREVALVIRILRMAVSEWNVTLPCGIPKIRLPRVSNGRERRVSDIELSTLLSSTSSEIAQKSIRFALATGMRRGEIVSICWRDIDLDNRTLYIPRTKTDSPRHIPLTQSAMTVLSMLDGNADDLVFPIAANSVSQAFRRATQRAGIDDLHYHDLRHEAITRFFELGLSVAEVASISGHKDYRMLERYTHIGAEHLANRIAYLVSQ